MTLLPEAVTIPLEDNGSGYLSKDSINKVLNQMKNKTVAAIGPGLSVNDDIIDLVYHIIENSNIPIVVDADALNSISKDTSILKKLKSEAVLTPHPFEMARMVGISIEDVQNNRIEVAREFACKWKVTLVLKGSKTIVAAPDGRVFINPTGNSGMATGGTGDVLTGVIAGLIVQGVKPFDAAVAGVYIHGLAGDSAAAVKGEHGIIAGDLVNELPFVVKKLTK